jgi:LPXTG-site transpeptidase (sortase) family protein
MSEKFPSPFWINILAVIGAIVVLVGTISICSNVVNAFGPTPAMSSSNTAALALGPALAVNPALLSELDTAATTTPIVPTHLIIPAIGVNTTIEPVGLKADGAMVAPSSFNSVAWYSLGAKPGAPGNAVIAGHVDNALTTAGVFEHLSDLTIGDTISVSGSSGNALVYVVTQVQAYDADSAPTGSIFATTGPSQLVLITCDGEWDTVAHQFDNRLIVTAHLAQ